MLYLVLLLGIGLWPGLAEAIKWDFDDGTTQGWAAKQAWCMRVVWLKSTCFRGRSQTACGRLMCPRQWPAEADPSSECPSDFFDHRLRFVSVRPNPGPASHRPSSSYGWFLFAGLDQ